MTPTSARITPEELARELGVPGLLVRNWLRANYRRPQAEKYQRWRLSEDVADAVRAHFAGR